MSEEKEFTIKVTRTAIDSDTFKVTSTSLEDAEAQAKSMAELMPLGQSGNVEFEAEEEDSSDDSE